LNEKTAEIIIQILEEKKPENVGELINLAKARIDISEKEIFNCMIELQSEGKIELKKPLKPIPQHLTAYLKTEESRWYWMTIGLAIATTLIVFAIPEDIFPIIYARYILGSVFVLWLPGYSLTKALFPPEAKSEKSGGNFDSTTRVALSMGLSLALVPLVGLLLNYTPWGIRLNSVTLSLFLSVLFFATVGVIKEHQTKTKEIKK